MKTAGQELLERLTNLSNITFFNGKKSDCDIIDKISNMVRNDLIPKEKQQIIDAHYHGSEEPYSLSIGANKYYNETFY